MFSAIGTVIVGLIVGVIARFLLPGKEALPEGLTGILLTIVIGIAGAFLGTFIGGMLWGGENYVAGWIMSIVGAVILLLLLRLVFGSKAEQQGTIAMEDPTGTTKRRRSQRGDFGDAGTVQTGRRG